MKAGSAPPADGDKNLAGKRIVRIVIACLFLDLLAFTLILPLFPRLTAWYLEHSPIDSDNLLRKSLSATNYFRSFLTGSSGASHSKWDVTLLGGFIGSLFSFCQFIISPTIGSLADRYGRKPILLLTMLGNIASSAIWMASTNYESFMLSRLIGGLSEGNVQLSLLMISDVTAPSNLTSNFILIGVVFSVAFTLGPSLGAWFAKKSLPNNVTFGMHWNPFVIPATLATCLLVAEFVSIYLLLPETKGFREQDGSENDDEDQSRTGSHPNTLTKQKILQKSSQLHLLFLLFFSGAEFTLTFLTYDLFGYTNAQNGALLGYIGILTAALQGGYVRKAAKKVGEARIAQRGILAAAMALLLLAVVPKVNNDRSEKLLWLAATFLAFTSATVVGSLNAIVSMQCEDARSTGQLRAKQDPGKGISNSNMSKGYISGKHRSAGQLGRAIGPLLTCSIYWSASPTVCYLFGSIAMLTVSVMANSIIKLQNSQRHEKTS